MTTAKVSAPKRAFFWLVLAAMVCAPVAAAEIYLRSVGLGDPIVFYENETYLYAPQPNQQRSRQRDVTVTIDSKGLRTTKDWTTKADAKILFVGDSVTWAGTYIDDRDTFAHGVCERLEKTTGKTFVCGNAGVNQYGVRNMAERIRHKDFNDEAVLVVTLISHDAVRGLAPALGMFHLNASPPAPFKAIWEASAYLAYRVRQLFPAPAPNIPDNHVPEPSVQELLSALRETARPNRKVLIVFSPLKGELNGRESELTKRVRAVLEQSGFDILDLHADVTKAYTDNFYYDPYHLEVAGHRFYADRIAERLLPHFRR